jgi:hypothetical protein
VPRDLRITNDAGSRLLERFGHAELAELRRHFEEALALALRWCGITTTTAAPAETRRRNSAQ